MAIKLCITFGQVHAHCIAGKLYHKDVVAVIECEGVSEGREIAWEMFGDKWYTSDTLEDFEKKGNLKYFPGGYVNVNF